MRDVEHRQAELVADAQQEGQHAGSQREIEGRQGFVEQDGARPRGERPCQGHALPLAPRQLVHAASEQPAKFQDLDRTIE